MLGWEDADCGVDHRGYRKTSHRNEHWRNGMGRDAAPRTTEI